jgi:hypothetical protein
MILILLMIFPAEPVTQKDQDYDQEQEQERPGQPPVDQAPIRAIIPPPFLGCRA